MRRKPMLKFKKTEPSLRVQHVFKKVAKIGRIEFWTRLKQSCDELRCVPDRETDLRSRTLIWHIVHSFSIQSTGLTKSFRR